MTAFVRHPLVLGLWIVVLTAVAGGVAAAIWSEQQEARYEAVGTVFVQPNRQLETGADVVDGLYPLDQSRLIPTYGDIASSASVEAEAARRLGLPDADDYEVVARMLPESFALDVAVTGPEPQVAEAFATEVIEIAGRRFTEAFRVYSVSDLSPPRASRSDLGLLPAAGAGLLSGTVAGVLLAVLVIPSIRSRSTELPRVRLRAEPGETLVGLR